MAVLRLAALLAAVVALAGAGCYDPKIQDGGLACAPGDGGAGRCPEGFQCSAADNHCYRSGEQCAKAPAPLCQDAPKPGSACSPVCQTGCSCGRCNISGLVAVCAPFIGPKKLGEVCAPERDDCEAGPDLLARGVRQSPGPVLPALRHGHPVRVRRRVRDPDPGRGGDRHRLPDLRSGAAGLRSDCQDRMPEPGAGLLPEQPGGGGGQGAATFCDCPNQTLPADSACDAFNDCAPGLVCASGSGVAASAAGQSAWRPARPARPASAASRPAAPASATAATDADRRLGGGAKVECRKSPR